MCLQRPSLEKTQDTGAGAASGAGEAVTLHYYTFQSVSNGLLLGQNTEYLKTINPISQLSIEKQNIFSYRLKKLLSYMEWFDSFVRKGLSA